MMILLLASILAFMGLTYYIYQRRRFLLLAFQIPSPVWIPFIGDIVLLVRHKFNLIKALGLINKTYGDCYALWARQLLVVISRPEDMEILMTNPAMQDRGEFADGVVDVVGSKSLLTLNWEDSKQVKKALHQNFTNSSQAFIFENFRKSTDQLLQELEAQEGKWIKCLDFIKKATTSSICYNGLSENMEKYPIALNILSHIDEILFLCICRGFSPLHRIDFIYNHVFGWKHYSSLIEEASKDLNLVISAKRHELSVLKEKGEEVPNQYVFNVLQEERNGDNTNEDLVKDISTLIGAALDTSAVTASFALLMLAIHPQYQQLVYEEDQRIQQELDGRDLDERSIAKYDILTRVVKETLRMYPSVPVIPRRVNEETKYGKYIVPKGATVLASILTLHRDSAVYAKPTVFDPDRFLPENVAKRPKYSYLPFGAGPRACPGFRYGMQNTICTVCSIIRKYNVSSKYSSVQEVEDNLTTIPVQHRFQKYRIMRRNTVVLSNPANHFNRCNINHFKEILQYKRENK